MIQSIGSHRERERTVEGDDEYSARGILLEGVEDYQGQRLEPHIIG
jgi:hypothetical protein